MTFFFFFAFLSNLNFRSDGTQPHLINLQFLKKVRIQVNIFFSKKSLIFFFQEVALYIDFKNDESYTPNKISVRAGTTLQDLKVLNYFSI